MTVIHPFIMPHHFIAREFKRLQAMTSINLAQSRPNEICVLGFQWHRKPVAANTVGRLAAEPFELEESLGVFEGN